MALISNGDEILTKRVYNSDETVLWEGNASSPVTTVTVSESLNNFESFKIYWCHFYDEVKTVTIMEYSPLSTCVFGFGARPSALKVETLWSISETTLTRLFTKYTIYDGQWSNGGHLFPLKIIGVNRISGGNV